MQVAGDASIEVELAARNAVTSIALCEDSLPAEGLAAGASTVITAQVMLGQENSSHIQPGHICPRPCSALGTPALSAVWLVKALCLL